MGLTKSIDTVLSMNCIYHFPILFRKNITFKHFVSTVASEEPAPKRQKCEESAE